MIEVILESRLFGFLAVKPQNMMTFGESILSFMYTDNLSNT